MRELLTTSNDPEGILRTPCKPVKTIDSIVKSLAQELADYMLSHREDKLIPIGLAAPQLGEDIQVFVFYPNPTFKERRAIQILINPAIDRMSKYGTFEETCLSIPGKVFEIRRAERTKVKGLGIDGQPRTFKAVYLLARVFQHEIDHLNGVLIDEAGELVREA